MRLPIALALLVLLLAGLVAWLAIGASSGAAVGGAPDSSSAPLQAGELRADRELDAPADTVASVSAAPSGRALESSAQRSVAGRVVHASSNEGLADFGLVARLASEVLAEDSSDARGRFVLLAIAADEFTLEVTPPYGWVALDTPRKIRRDEHGEFESVEVRARPAGFAPFRARLVDEQTREPVPHYFVRIGSQLGGRSNAWSNAEGVLTSEHDHPESTLLLFGYDVLHPDLGSGELKPNWYREVPHTPRDGASEELELAIPVGPTYRIELDAPAQAPRDRLLALVGTSVTPFPRASSARHPGVGVVRTNDGIWVRFPPRGRGPASAGSLSVYSLDGCWFGDGPVTTRRGIDPQSVSIRLERRARIFGRAVDGQGGAVAKAQLTLFGRDRSGDFARLELAESSANGLFEFPFAPAGAYVVRGMSLSTETREFAFDVLEGEDFEFELVMPLLSRKGPVSGIVRAAPGLEFTTCKLFLASTRHPGQILEQRSAFEARERGREVAFEFLDTPAGEYSLTVDAWGASDGLTREVRIDVLAPREGIVVELPSAENLLCIELNAVDARSQAQVGRTWFELANNGACDYGESLGPRVERCLPAEFVAGSRWWLAAAGYRPASGEVSALEFLGGVANLRVELTPGWGVGLEVLGPEFTPLAGVDVVADGKKVATTDSAGRALLALDEKPTALELRRAGWRTELDSLHALNLALRRDALLLRLWMAPH
jgi:hypothetical protein